MLKKLTKREIEENKMEERRGDCICCEFCAIICGVGGGPGRLGDRTDMWNDWVEK
ncbi:MAG: hypothetical protein U9Q27_01610 [Patescibacteria group bacterium]|nr:hypothetical protein [Patescibacteria group bacterium]